MLRAQYFVHSIEAQVVNKRQADRQLFQFVKRVTFAENVCKLFVYENNTITVYMTTTEMFGNEWTHLHTHTHTQNIYI